MQLVLVNNRIVAHGEGFLAMGGVVINPETGAKYDNATIAEHEGGCPSDIDVVGYEYHAGRFVPCAPYGKTNSGSVMVACEECGTPRRSGVSIENGTVIPESADGNNVFEKGRVVDDVTHKAAVSVGPDGATVLKHYHEDEVKGQVETDSEGAYWRSVPTGERRSLLTDIVASSYTGDDAAERFINLGFTPSAVLVVTNGAFISNASGYAGYAGLAVTGSPVVGCVEIVTNGFKVYNQNEGKATDIRLNHSSYFYNYIAVRR